MTPDRCTCRHGRDTDGSEFGPCEWCESAEQRVHAMEAEANAFAFELLMPEAWLRADLKKIGGVDLEGDEKKIDRLSRKYRVSRQAMIVRIAQLSEAC